MPSQPVTIACVVEGHGEGPALPKLLYRIARELSVWDLRVPEPFRMPRGKLVAAGGIERVVETQARRVGGAGGVLVLLDADDDCPATLGPSLLMRARAARPDKAVSVVLASREFENVVRQALARGRVVAQGRRPDVSVDTQRAVSLPGRASQA